jgi:hypothetical protein
LKNSGRNKHDSKSKSLEKEVFVMAKEKKQTSIQGGVYPSQKYVPGDSVDKHKDIEDATIMLAGDEIRQQNENL